MPLDQNTLVALIASRICHDLVSPMAAVTTALDVMDTETSADMREHAMQVVRSSASDSRAKLEFLRAAFGSATAGTGTADLGELKRIAEAYVGTAKPELVWSTTEVFVPRIAARLLLNLIIVGVDSLPRGGQIVVTSLREGGRIEFQVACTGKRASLKDAVREALQGLTPEGGFDGRTIQPYMTFLSATAARAELAARDAEESVTLIARVPAEEMAGLVAG
jgi:histidine phosphotransferase ChpT